MRVPIVTQVQGAALYRTSLTIGNNSGTQSANVTLVLSYRSPVDSTFQTKSLAVSGPIGPHRSFFLEDFIQAFKDAGAIRSQDASVGLFGSLLVRVTGISNDDDISVVARTYSPATGGGTNGIAYIGRRTDQSGSPRVHAILRNGVFGADGQTRANIGFVNEGNSPVDVQITYFDANTGVSIKSFQLSDVTHRLLEPEEVFQLSNVFGESGVPAGTTRILVQAQPSTPGTLISGYAVQLDATTNDGSFFIMSEYHN